MPPSSQGSEDGSGTGSGMNSVSNQLASLVPSFDPAVDDVTIWSNKIELLLEAWPPTKLVELATRLILNTKGTAFQKLQLMKGEILVNDRKGIKKLVETVGGTWGQAPLEKRFELAEKAIFRSQQKGDEGAESYVSRCDVLWTELLAKGIKLEELQAYIVLRGSRLQHEDKKRAVIDSETDGKLAMEKATSSIRMLGSGFFQEYTGGKRDTKNNKTYDHTAFSLEEEADVDSQSQEVFWVSEEIDDDTVEWMAADNDEDALTVIQFEESIMDSIQADPEINTFFSQYQEARRRLNERAKTRGFWPVSQRSEKGQFKGGKKGSKGKGKGKGFNPAASLAKRIANSFCRVCLQKGHWKNECPMRNGTSSASSSPPASSAPTSVAIASEVPPEIASFTTIHEDHRGFFWGNGKPVHGINLRSKHQFSNHLRHSLRKKWTSEPAVDQVTPCREPASVDHSASNDSIEHEIHFASEGTIGIVDLGASQTVIGSTQVPELLAQLPEQIRSQVKRTSCNLVFRFGNHQTLNSRHALVFPLRDQWFRIAIVPGKTPFLLSSAFLKGIKAVIDTDQETMWSKMLNRHLQVTRTAKNLFLLDLNQLSENEEPSSAKSVSHKGRLSTVSFSTKEKTCLGATDQPLESPELTLSEPSTMKHVNHSGIPTAVNHPASSTQSCASQSTVSHDQPGCPSQAVPPEHSEAERRNRPRPLPQNASGGTGQGEDHLRNCSTQQDLRGGLQGPQVDRWVHREIREEQQASPSGIPHLRGEDPRPGSPDNNDPRIPEDQQGEREASLTTELRMGSSRSCGSENPGLIFDMEERLLHLQEANVNVNSRLTSVEMTMTEILQAVHNLSVKSEP